MIIHTVMPGETLFSIAARYGVSPSDLILYNGLDYSSELVTGQNLLVLIPQRVYTLTSEITVDQLSSLLGIDTNRLIQYNPSLQYESLLPAGRTIVLSYAGEGDTPLFLTGYAYPFISEEALSPALPYLSALAVFTYGLDAEGNLVFPETDDERVINAAKASGANALMLLSTLSADGNFNNTLSSALFASPEAQNNLFSQILETMRTKGYDALEVDFEYIAPNERQAYADFIADLREVMNQNGYTLTVALAPKTYDEQPGLLYEAHDYAALGQNADAVLLMTYEWGYTYGPPQAVAPIDKVRAVVEYALTRIPNEKILLGIPNYGYDWTLPYVEGSAARSLSSGEALDLAARYGAEILFDNEAASPYFYYTDDDMRAHVVWFEDPRSIKAKLDLIAEKELLGAGIWTIMRPADALFAESALLFDIQKEM